MNEGSILPRIFPSTQFNYGILVALFCVVVVTWMLYKTPFGFSLRAMGSNPRAMQQAGLRSMAERLRHVHQRRPVCSGRVHPVPGGI